MRAILLVLLLLTAAPAAADTQAEIDYWSSVKASGDPDTVRTYLERYPGGIFTRLAEALAAALERRDGGEATAADDGEPDPDLPRYLQAALDDVGCDPGPIDGVWGPRSKRALAEFAEHAVVTLPDEPVNYTTLDMIESYGEAVCPSR